MVTILKVIERLEIKNKKIKIKNKKIKNNYTLEYFVNK